MDVLEPYEVLRGLILLSFPEDFDAHMEYRLAHVDSFPFLKFLTLVGLTLQLPDQEVYSA